MSKVFARVCGILLLAACGVPQWNKPGSTRESIEADLKACEASAPLEPRVQAPRSKPGVLIETDRMIRHDDRQARADSRHVAECMRAKGYTDAAHIKYVGTFEAVLPAASAGERHIRVMLQTDGAASLTSTFSGRPSRFLAEGRWTGEGSRVTVTLKDETLVFHLAGDQLVAKEWDRSRWGESGPGVLNRIH